MACLEQRGRNTIKMLYPRDYYGQGEYNVYGLEATERYFTRERGFTDAEHRI